MNISCEIIKDLLPLYHDNVCSAESRSLIESHISECDSCSKLLSDISDELECPVNTIDEAKPIKSIQIAWEKDKVKSFIKGAAISVLVFAVLVGAFIGLTQWYIVPVPTSIIEISEVSALPDGSISFNLRLKDNKELRFVEYEPVDGLLYMTPKRAVISMSQPVEIGPVSRDMWVDNNARGDATACYIGTTKDRILIWEEGMELPSASGDVIKRFESNINNIYITNESTAAIALIVIHSANQSHGATVADNSSFPAGEVLGFHLDAEEGCLFTVQAEDESGNLIAQADFTKNVTYNADEQIHLYIRDGDDGTVFISDTEF